MSWTKNGTLCLKFRKRFDPGSIETALHNINRIKFNDLFQIDTCRSSKHSLIVRWRVCYKGHMLFDAVKVGAKQLEFHRVEHIWYPYFQLAFARAVLRSTASVCKASPSPMPSVTSIKEWMADMTAAYDSWLSKHFSMYRESSDSRTKVFNYPSIVPDVNMDSIPIELRDF